MVDLVCHTKREATMAPRLPRIFVRGRAAHGAIKPGFAPPSSRYMGELFAAAIYLLSVAVNTSVYGQARSASALQWEPNLLKRTGTREPRTSNIRPPPERGTTSRQEIALGRPETSFRPPA